MRVVEKALTFDDVLLVPAHSTILPRDVNLKSRLTRGITLNIPVASAAMDTVTEARLAIAVAQEGGIGIVHKNMSPKAQAIEVTKVKRFESGIVKDPITVTEAMTVREVLQITQQHRISGLPVVNTSGKVIGIVTNRDLRFETELDQPIKNIMTPRERLVTVREGSPREEALALMHKHRLERVLVINENFELRGLITVKDILKSSEHPHASKDDLGRLRVGAAVGVGEGTEERVEALLEAAVDVIVVDTAHGHSEGVLSRVRWIKRAHPKTQVIGGNIATAAAAKALVDNGADGVKVGIGPGSICTTRIVAGIGVPQITAVANVAKALARTDVPLIADGGIRYSGDIAKAIAAGAHSV
ncbi:MAG: IMP dehydrogenase, partial [Burkholderiales bacterium]